MKKMIHVLFLSLLAMSFIVLGCGNKYADANKMNEEYVSLMENYFADLDKAENASDTAKAMNKFADGMAGLWPKMQALSEKYPELKDKSNTPEELKKTQKQVDEVSKKMTGSMMKSMQYMTDPEVRKAHQRLGEIMIKK